MCAHPSAEVCKNKYRHCAVARARVVSSTRSLQNLAGEDAAQFPNGEQFPEGRGPRRTRSLATWVSPTTLDVGVADDDVSQTTTSRVSGFTLRSADPSTYANRSVTIEEVVAPTKKLLDTDEENSLRDKSWFPSLAFISGRKHGTQEADKRLSKQVRHFYKQQDEFITMLEGAHGSDLSPTSTAPPLQNGSSSAMPLTVEEGQEEKAVLQNSPQQGKAVVQEAELRTRKIVSRIAKATFCINFLLLAAKAVAVGLSGSLSIISSLVDSCVDLVSGFIIFWTTRAMKNRSIYLYPQGRTRLEPVAVVILSVIMSIASLQVIIESIECMVNKNMNPDVGWTTVGLILATICTKMCLYLFCRRYKNPSVQALCQDHRNDVLSNIFALAGGFIGSKWWVYADPIGAILISLYILISWWKTGAKQIRLLTGHTARPVFMQQLTWLSFHHDARILYIDTVRAFHFGNNFIVEVDIVLPEDMLLREAHDVGESLQQRLESLPEVERAFVHLDYEFQHHPSSEHKEV
ncbi:PREDICTED: metal tolerance protein 11-like isoform X2 [Priapulus caudatus]|nr:PREDICTED: metal tolerance protein 11-like isoform X2 [Priapulus caudatus]